ncbi:MAG: DUF4174 domain-containing protein [Sedimenticolaceae bacterium]
MDPICRKANIQPSKRTSRSPIRYASLIGATLAATLALGAAAYDLDQHVWRDRLLFLIAPTPDDPLLEAQAHAIEQRKVALRDRDLRVFMLNRESATVDDLALDAGEAEQLRRRLEVTDDDRLMILVGKDGGVKRRAALDTDLRDIFLQIDGMPMRRAEIRAKEAAGEQVTTP